MKHSNGLTQGWRWVGTALLSAMLAGCQSVRTTAPGSVGVEREQLMSPMVSEAQLRQGAVQAYAQVLGQERARSNLNPDPAMTERVRAISAKLIAALSLIHI